jgi:hypothetical protein
LDFLCERCFYIAKDDSDAAKRDCCTAKRRSDDAKRRFDDAKDEFHHAKRRSDDAKCDSDAAKYDSDAAKNEKVIENFRLGLNFTKLFTAVLLYGFLLSLSLLLTASFCQPIFAATSGRLDCLDFVFGSPIQPTRQAVRLR